MVTPESFKIRFPEFANIDNSIIQMLLDESYLLLSKENKYQDTLVLYYTAHNLVVQQRQTDGNYEPSQAEANKSVGSVSVGYTSATVENETQAYYKSTSYGQKYLEYKRAICIGQVFLA